MDEIKPGYTVGIDESDSDQYDTIASAVDSHNESAAPGEHYWGISIENGSYTVYEYGEVPTPPTEAEQLETLRAEKLKAASDACEQTICAGIDVTFSDGTQEHFSLQPNDQTNIDGIFSAVTLGVTSYPYHADGELCKMYSASDIVKLYVAAKGHVTQQTTYNNALRQWIKRETSLGTLKSISYGVDLPEDLKAEVADILQKAKEQVEAIVAKLTTTVSA